MISLKDSKYSNHIKKIQFSYHLIGKVFHIT